MSPATVFSSFVYVVDATGAYSSIGLLIIALYVRNESSIFVFLPHLVEKTLSMCIVFDAFAPLLSMYLL